MIDKDKLWQEIININEATVDTDHDFNVLQVTCLAQVGIFKTLVLIAGMMQEKDKPNTVFNR